MISRKSLRQAIKAMETLRASLETSSASPSPNGIAKDLEGLSLAIEDIRNYLDSYGWHDHETAGFQRRTESLIAQRDYLNNHYKGNFNYDLK